MRLKINNKSVGINVTGLLMINMYLCMLMHGNVSKMVCLECTSLVVSRSCFQLPIQTQCVFGVAFLRSQYYWAIMCGHRLTSLVARIQVCNQLDHPFLLHHRQSLCGRKFFLGVNADQGNRRYTGHGHLLFDRRSPQGSSKCTK